MPELLTQVASPGLAYLALFGLLLVDAFLPVVPTQLLMLTGGALTVYGGLSLPWTVAAGALGVFAGDLACYLLGRSAPGRRPPRPVGAGRTRRMAGRVSRGLRRSGPMTILLCRFVPGGRMAACFAAGRSRYPLRFFLPYASVAAVAWASYGGLLGHLGGAALTGSTWQMVAIAAMAAAGFALTGWALALLAARLTRTPTGTPAD
ncbi:membrane protein DedA, SNARE-associated domain [Micromonospora phaseoli]|uniref:Membrane protein DedA, SNARE-associated domain n=1 Tax=Micromonospora phaseoli TaxID=1144548 RepID=A0A1H6ZZH0_9ACTN|nr:VTT domain-containing protein [Micromonospora phaseoli]PZV97091.1 membrane protein DedA with SNARE-associated domain [Micromonospora phaseoli]SEJ55152.1 membrane protein DedA, SNARE-associated domain [Micromonospora phaseoli]